MGASQHQTLLQCFRHWEKTLPDRVYLTQPFTHAGGDGRVVDYSFREVGDQARRMAAHLQSLGFPAGSRIAILGRNSAHWIMADLAIWMAGYVSVPLYPTLNEESAAYILAHCEAQLLFVGKMDGKADGWNEIQRAIPASLPRIALPMAPLPEAPQWDALIARQPPLADPADPPPSQLATIIYTSGSTGQPKGVMHSFGSMYAAPGAIGSQFPSHPDDRMISYLPLAHAAERAVVETGSLFNGFRVYFAAGLDTFVTDLQRARPTIFFSVPRLWTKFRQGVLDQLPEQKLQRLLRIPVVAGIVKRRILRQLGLDHVRVAITGSAALPPHIIAWYRSLGLELLEGYAMSEDFCVSHFSRPGEVRVGYVGTPLPGVTARVADNGEVQVKSPGNMLGYYKNPGLTAESYTPDGFFRTGDRGVYDEQGRLRITGRVKELFKTTKGKYIAPVPIENKLGLHPKIEAVCLTGPGQPQPFALLMLSLEAQQALREGRANREALAQEFRSLLQQVNVTLEDHEQMDYLVVVKDQWTMDNGFLTPTMKIRRSVIEERYLARADSWLRARQPVIWE
jgi:long-chain acyl-CoA synthetase